MSEAFYEPAGNGRFVGGALTRGPWSPKAQHGGPPAALLGRALERCEPRDDTRIARATFDILRPVPVGPLAVEARMARPGRRVAMLHATLTADGVEVMRAQAWRIRTVPLDLTATDLAATSDAAIPPPETGDASSAYPSTEDVGYHTAMEWRFISGDWQSVGPSVVWLRMQVPLVAGEEQSPLQRVLVAADCGSGVSAAVDFHTHVYINPDLTVALHRDPVGEWIALDAATSLSSDGIGLASTAIADREGVIGRGLQSLLVDKR